MKNYEIKLNAASYWSSVFPNLWTQSTMENSIIKIMSHKKKLKTIPATRMDFDGYWKIVQQRTKKTESYSLRINFRECESFVLQPLDV